MDAVTDAVERILHSALNRAVRIEPSAATSSEVRYRRAAVSLAGFTEALVRLAALRRLQLKAATLRANEAGLTDITDLGLNLAMAQADVQVWFEMLELPYTDI